MNESMTKIGSYTHVIIHIHIRDVVITFANVIITTQLLCEISCNDYNCNY